MTEYEILLLLDPDVSEERQSEIVTRVRETVERDGSWDRHDVWGRRKLAYEIDHKPEGFYHLLLFSSSAETLDEITRVLRITDGVLRHLAVRRLKSSTAAEPQAAPAAVEATEPEAASPAEPAEPEAATETDTTTEPAAATGAETTADSEAEPEVVQEAG